MVKEYEFLEAQKGEALHANVGSVFLICDTW